MAARVNTKFVIGLSTVLVVLVMGLAGYYWFFVRQNPEELIARGDRMVAEEHWAAAANFYGRALDRDSSNPAWWERFAQILTEMTVDDHLDAQDRVGQLREAYRRIAELRPTDEQAQQDYFNLLYELAEDRVASHALLYDEASGRVERNPSDVIARKYRAIARVHQLHPGMSESDKQQPYEDLTQVLEQRPDDAMALHYLARWMLFRAQELDRPGGDRGQAAAFREQAVDLAERKLAVDEDSQQRQVLYVRIMLDPQVDDQAAAESVLERLEPQLELNPEPHRHVLQVVELLQRLEREVIEIEEGHYSTRGIERARRLLEAAQHAHPRNPTYPLMLSRVMRLTGEASESRELLERVRELGVRAEPRAYMRNRMMRLDATIQLARVELSTLGEAEDAAGREARIERARELWEEAREMEPDVPSVTLLEGQLALVEREFARAAMLADEALERYGYPNQDALRAAAHAYRRQGEWGAAAQRLEQLLAAHPERPDVRQQLVEAYLEAGQNERAMEHLEPLVEQAPRSHEVRQLQARLLSRVGRLDEAIAALEGLDPHADTGTFSALLQLYGATNRELEVDRLLKERLERAPSDLRALQMKLARTEDRVEQRRLLDDARRDGANDEAISRLERWVEGETIEFDEMLEQARQQREDPLDRALLSIQLYERAGDEQGLRGAIEEAAEIDPNHRQVVERQFELAIRDEDWDLAEELVARAREHDLDLAQGAFFAGRLAMAQNEMPMAVAQFRQGLSGRQVYSEGWRLLGEALHQQGNYNEAEEALQNAIEQRPGNVRALRLLASVQAQQGQHSAALRTLRSALERQTDPQLLRQYIRYEEEYGDREQALQLRQQLAQIMPGDLENRRFLAIQLARSGDAEQVEQARQIMEQLIEREGETLQNVSALAEVYRFGGEPDEGLEMLNQFVEEHGEEAGAQGFLLRARYKHQVLDQEPSRVIEAYEQAVALEDDAVGVAARELADLLFRFGQVERAMELYRGVHEAQPENERVALRLADALLQIGELDEAESVLEEFEAEGAQAVGLKGIIARERGDVDRALSLLDEAIGLDPTHAPLYLERARTRLASEADRQEAINDLEDALDADSNLIPARELLVRVHLGTGDMRSAARELERILSRLPRQREARVLLINLHLANREMPAAERLLTEAAELFPEEAVWRRMQAQVAEERDDPEAALAYWRQASELEPSATNLTGWIHRLNEMGRGEQAMEVVEQYGSELEHPPVAHALRARASEAVGDRSAARSHFASALSSCERFEELHLVAIHLYEAYGPSEAVATLEQSEELEPAWRAVAAAELEYRGNQYGRALDRLAGAEAALAEAEGEVVRRGRQIRARSLHESGAHEEAMAAYRQLLEDEPGNPAYLNNLAFLLANDLDQPGEALPLAEQAAEQAPRDARVLDTLGRTHYKLGNLEEARRMLEQSVGLEPRAMAFIHLAEVYRDMQAADNAQAALDEAIRLAEVSENTDALTQARELEAQMNR